MCGHANVVADRELAIVCSPPVVTSRSAQLPEFSSDFPRQALSLKLLVDGPLLVTNTHLAYPAEMVQEKKTNGCLALFLKHRRLIEGHTAKILCGDFNDIESSPAIRTVLQSDQGFQDAFAVCFPNNPGITYARRNTYVDPSWTLDQ